MKTHNLILAAFILPFGFAASAQKLPNTQQTNLRAPAGIIIDGNATDWDNTFQAHNNATELSYIIANNDENLYLVINADYSGTIQKIVAGGITFSIINADKKNAAMPVTISYPVMSDFISQGSTAMVLRGTPTATDLAMMNKNFTDNTKELPVTGIKDITDESVSIYNELGIKAAQHVDDKKTYTAEIAIPVKYIKDMIDATGTFSYKIQVNGLHSTRTVRVVGGSSINASDAPVVQGSANYLLAPTYLTGTYTLAKK